MLPRVNLSSDLYPTDHMKEAVTEIFKAILDFLVRSLDWYEKRPLSIAINSVFHPVALQYSDLLQKIAELSRRIDDLAVAGRQAETRDIHRTLEAMLRMLAMTLGPTSSLQTNNNNIMLAIARLELNVSCMLDS
jgi:hypothetical protein